TPFPYTPLFRSRPRQAAVPRLAHPVLALHPLDDAAVRGHPRAALPGRHAPRPRRHLPRPPAPADGRPLLDLPDEAVHPDAPRRADRRRARRRRERAAHLLGGRAAPGAARPGLPGHRHVRRPVELVRVAAGGDALERHAHPAGGPGPDKGAGAAVLRPADGRGHARRRARDRRVLRVPALLPARRDRGGAQGMTDTESSAPAAGIGPAGALPARRLAGGSRPSVGFDLDGVLIRNPFETCVVPRLAALLKATPCLKDLGEHEATRAVRQRVSGGWQRRMGAGDLVGAYDWDAI